MAPKKQIIHTNLWVYFLFLVVFTNCNISANKKSKTIKYINKSGYIIKNIDSNGLLLKEQQLQRVNNDTIEDGYCKIYYPNGNIKQWEFYRNDTLDSLQLLYYPNGKLKARYYRLGGNKWGIQKEYDSLGYLSYAYFMNIKGHLLFTMGFYKEHILLVKGIPIYMESNDEPISAHRNFVMANHVFVLDGIKTILSIKLLDHDHILKQITVSDFEHYLNSNFYFFSYVFKRPGNYTYNVNVQLIDERTKNLLRNYTSNLPIEVTK